MIVQCKEEDEENNDFGLTDRLTDRLTEFPLLDPAQYPVLGWVKKKKQTTLLSLQSIWLF